METHPASPPFVVTANVVYRRSVLEQLGGLDEDFRGVGYDADLAWRTGWAGYRIVLEPKAIVVHHHRSNLRSFMHQLRVYGRGESQVFLKHRERLGMRRYWNTQPYRQMLKALVKMPFAPLMGRTKLERVLPVLEFLDSFSYASAKVWMSLKLGVFYF